MSSKNAAVARNPVYTHEGAPAKNINAHAALARAVCACMLWEDTFYESGVSITTRIKDLVPKVGLDDVAQLAIVAREQLKLRHVPLLLVRELCRHYHDNKVGRTITRVIQRPDEITELLAIYREDGKSIPRQMKLGIANAFRKFNEYELAKWDKNNKAWRLRDALFLVHAKPADVTDGHVNWDRKARKEYAHLVQAGDQKKANAYAHSYRPNGFMETELLYGRIAHDQLTTPDTWEVALSGGADKKETFTRLLTEGKLGALALLRNLRNMEQSGIDRALIQGAIKNMKTERVLPYRFIAAARYAPSLEPELEEAMFKCVANHERLDGRTVLAIDVSGSMKDALSSKSDMNRLDAAAALAILLREICQDVRIFVFNANVEDIPPRRGFALRDAIGRPRGSTDIGLAVQHANRMGYDRLIVLTDEQSHTRVGNPVGKHGYMVNVGTNKNGVGYGAWNHIDGFSEAIVNWMLTMEKAKQQ